MNTGWSCCLRCSPRSDGPSPASLTDPDSVTSTNTDGSIETGVSWQWWRAPTADRADAPEFLDADEAVDRAAWEQIADSKSDTYKPVSDDEGHWLTAMATYTDRRGPGNTMHEPSANAVVANTDNVAPEFKEGGEPVMQATRYIVESADADADADVVVDPDGTTNSPEGSDIPDMVMATDPNGGPDTAEGRLTHTLGGPDKDSFEIDASSGQITVGADTELDYESNKKTYMVTVTATDPSRAMTTINVTINVIDVNEPPSFTAPSEGDVDKTVQENTRTLNIYTFRATDPERRKVYWSLATDSPDRDHFTISDSGVLSLNASPNYEDDLGLGDDGSYTVVVEASDDAPGAGINEEDPVKISTKAVTVTVEDVEEIGKITTLPKYPHVTNTVTAELTDGDGAPTITWEWTVNSVTPTGSGADSDSFIPAPEDVGKTLRVKASYTEDGDDKTVGPISAGIVRDEPAPQANRDPVFDPSTANRKVAENAGNMRLGDPIKANDPDNDPLTYTVDNANFSISSSGQLSTAAMLDREDSELSTFTYEVMVQATDPWGGTATNTVTVTVENVNEAPMIEMGPTRRDHVENVAIAISDYNATDVDADDADDALTWSLEGEDAAKFSIVEEDGMLTFKESPPDYEMPEDRNRDNVYKVTVVVSDDGTPKRMDKRQVEVTVTDVGEGGTVTLSAVQPKTGIDLMASLTDPDSVTSTNTDGSIETGVSWQWWRAPTADRADAPEFLDADEAVDRAAWEQIADSKSDTYKPVSDDEGHWLTAMATYTDRRGPGNTMHEPSANGVIVNTDNVAPMFKENNEEITETTRKVKEDAKPNAAAGGTLDETTRGNVGIQVLATDPNDSDLLTYTLRGPDRALFKITSDTGPENADRGGQISLNANTELDYEDRTTYMVTVTAADPDGEMASVDVTIKVTGVDEAPKIIAGGLVVRGTSAINYAENGTGMVATYSAAGPDAADATWSLSGADAGALSISSAGVLTFSPSPNYESPADANTDNIYMVMVNANDGTNDAMKTVTVRVTNEEEMGEVTLWAGADPLTMAPQVGETITGAVMDPDGGEMVESWQWSRTMDTADMNSWMDIQDATDAAYMVTADDTGYHLRVMATYTDAAGTDMAMEYSMSTMMVTAMMTVPIFDSETATREVAENTEASMDIGDPVVGTDADGGTLIYVLGGTDAGSFYIDPETGQLKTLAGLDYETKATYSVMVTATDPDSASDMITVTITVTNEDEMGEVTLWAGADALTMAPQVGDTITGAVMDPDGGVTGESWQWARTMDTADMSSWMDITGATDAAYMVTAGDTGYHLRVMATYTDAAGTDMAMEYSMPTMMVTAVDETQPADFDPLAKYDADKSGVLEKDEVIQAINDYLFGVGADAISKDDVIETINLYLFG